MDDELPTTSLLNEAFLFGYKIGRENLNLIEPEDCRLRFAMEEGFVLGQEEYDASQKAERNNVLYPDDPGGHWLCCPNGHETFHTTAGWMPCASCGATMTPEDEAYFQSLCRVGQCA